MAEPAPHHAHDALFKAGFSDPVNAAAFLSAELPQEVAALIDWSGLRLEPGSFIDAELRHAESDLLFAAPMAGGEGCIHLLFEHQSTPDPWIALRLLRYMVRIWEHRVRTRPAAAPLPVVIPVVLGQDAKVWQLEPMLGPLFSLTDAMGTLRPYVPDFRFCLLQLAAMPFDAIRGTPDGILVLRTLKAERIGALLGDAVWDESVLRQVSRALFEMMVHYVLGHAEIDTPAFERKVRSITTPEIRSNAMTLAQRYLDKGRQEGRQEGRLEGSVLSGRAAVLDVLEVRHGAVPDGLREVIEGIEDATRLRALLRSALQAPTLEAFAALL